MKTFSVDEIRGFESFQSLKNKFDHSTTNTIVRDVSDAARLMLARGEPAQEVFAVASYFLQNGLPSWDRLQDNEFREAPVPDMLAEPFIMAAHGYVPSPIDTSHVEMTPQMQSAVDAAAEHIHEGWRATKGLTVEQDPLMKPWSELTPNEKASTLSAATEAVKAIAAVGGATAADLDIRSRREELCACLDEHVHEVWARDKMAAGARYGVERRKNAQGRDVTHPDLLPFNDLTPATKKYDHDINVTVIEVLRSEGIDIAPQVKEKAAEKTTEKAVAYTPMTKAELGVPKAVNLRDRLAEDFFREDVEKALRENPKLVPGNEQLVSRARMMDPPPRDLYVDDFRYIPAGAEVYATGRIEVRRPFTRETKIEDISKDSSVRAAVAVEMWRQGFKNLEFPHENPGTPEQWADFKILRDEVRAPYMKRADEVMRRMQDLGFSLESKDESRGIRVDEDFTGYRNAARAVNGLFPEAAATLKDMTLYYNGNDPKIRICMFEDAKEEMHANGRNGRELCGRIFEEKVMRQQAVQMPRTNWNEMSLDARCGIITAAAQDFLKDLSDPLSDASLAYSVYNTGVSAAGVRNPVLSDEIRRRAYMFVSGASYADSEPKLFIDRKIGLLRSHVKSIVEYQGELNAYNQQSPMGRIFSKKPVYPAKAAEDASMDLYALKNAFNIVYATEKAISGIVGPGLGHPNDPSCLRGLGGGQEYVETVRTQIQKEFNYVSNTLNAIHDPRRPIEKNLDALRSLGDAKAAVTSLGTYSAAPSIYARGEKILDGAEAKLMEDYGIPRSVIQRAALSRNGVEFEGDLYVQPWDRKLPEPRKVHASGVICVEGGRMTLRPDNGTSQDLSERQDLRRALKEGRNLDLNKVLSTGKGAGKDDIEQTYQHKR